MKSRSFLCLWLALTVVSFVVASDDGDVVVLTDDNFKEKVMSEDLMLVEFYAPWCGHCKALEPKFKEAASLLLKSDPPIKLGKVDATAHQAAAAPYSIRGYPTLLVFRNGQHSSYMGSRETNDIVKFMKKQVGPAAKPCTSVAEVEALRAADDDLKYAVIGFFADKVSQMRSAFKIITNDMRDHVTFGIVTDQELAQEYGMEGKNTIVAFRQADNSITEYKGTSKTGFVRQWVTASSVPLVGVFTAATAPMYYQMEIPIVKLYTDVSYEHNGQMMRYYTNRLKKAAALHVGKLVFAFVDKAEFAYEVNALGRSKHAYTLVIQDEQQRFMMEEKISKAAVLKFAEDFLKNDLPLYIKSEPAPDNSGNDVKVVVGKTFAEIADNDEKDVLIEFYAPWCGHCKALSPKYEELAAKVKHIDTLTIAKIDATANNFDRSRYEVSGYPTIYFKPAGMGPIKHTGEREVKSFVRFMRKHATHKFSLKKGGSRPL